jgi:hypothetical protein
MSLAVKVSDLATRIGTEFKAVRATIGSLTGLTTTDKTSIVAAVNELNAGKQPIDADLSAIAALAGASGLLKKTAADTWSLDTTSYVPSSTMGAANGVASLDASGLIPTSQMPPLAISEPFIVASQAAMLALTAQRGDVAIRTDVNKTYILATDSPSTLADWKEMLTPTDAVSSVDGRVGAVTLADLYAPYSLIASVGDTTTNFVTVFEAALV